MRRFFLFLSLFLLCLPVRLAAGSPPLGWSMDGVEVQGLGDSLAVRIRWTFLDWNVDAAKAVVFSPSVRNGSRSVTLRPVSVYGRKAARKASTYVASGDGREVAVVDLSTVVSLVTEDVFPRQDWMDTLKVTLQVCDWSRGSGLSVRSTSSRGTFARPEAPDSPVFSWSVREPARFSGGTRTVSFSSPVRFRDGAAKFDASLMSGPEADSLYSFLTKVKTVSSSKRYSVVSSELFVSVPPSGNAKEADKLSRNRCSSMYTYLQRGGAFRLSQPARKGGGEDWTGASAWVALSRFGQDGRLAEILSGEGDVVSRWDVLSREKPAAMEALRKECFPGLGRVVYKAVVRSPELKAASFVREIYDVVPEYLSPHDFWLLSTEYASDSPAWMDVILSGVRCCPDDPALCYDAVMGLLDRGAVDRAAEYLRGTGTLSADGRYAFAVWLFRKGRYGEALVVLDTLKDVSQYYLSIWESAAPFINWYRGRVFWKRVYV